MQVVEVELKTPEGDQGFLKANERVLEQLAIKTYIDLMNSSNVPAEIKLNAAKSALAAIGKEKPIAPALPPGQTTNIQINAALGGHVAEALRGLGETARLLSTNAPQTFEVAE